MPLYFIKPIIVGAIMIAYITFILFLFCMGAISDISKNNNMGTVMNDAIVEHQKNKISKLEENDRKLQQQIWDLEIKTIPLLHNH